MAERAVVLMLAFLLAATITTAQRDTSAPPGMTAQRATSAPPGMTAQQGTTAQRGTTVERNTTASELRVAVDELQAAAAAAAKQARAPAALSLNADWLHDSVFGSPFSDGRPRTNPEEVTLEYTRSLRLASELIRRNPSASVLADIAADLESKVEHCRRLGIGMGGVIRVRVNTRRGGETVKNLQVRYLLKFYEYIKGAQPGTFARFSSPTEEPLAPGRYWIWAFDPATGHETARTLVKVAGKRELVVDVPVT